MLGLKGRLEELLEEVAARPGLRSVLVVSRDGFCILSHAPRLSNPETFSAMTATCFGAGEAAMSVLGPEPVRSLVSDTRESRIVVTGIDDDYLLVLITDRRTGTEADLQAAQEVAATAGKLLRG